MNIKSVQYSNPLVKSQINFQSFKNVENSILFLDNKKIVVVFLVL